MFQTIRHAVHEEEKYEFIRSQPVGGLPRMQQSVFSTTLKQGNSGTTLISEEIETTDNRIKNEPGNDIWLFGGAGLTTSLMNLGLVDELQLAVHPTIFGRGNPLFRKIDKRG